MKIQILGSAAAEGIPALWCDCEVCAYARQNGGKDVRRRTSYLIDDDTLVDFGPDGFWQSVEFGIDLNKIKRVLFSHAHDDHTNVIDLQWRRRGFSKVGRKLKVFANAAVHRKITDYIGEEEQIFVTPFIFNGADTHRDGDMQITAIPAYHSDNEIALNYIIERENKSILIANDTGWWAESSWDMAAGRLIDAAIIECTYGFAEATRAHKHLSTLTAIDFRDELIKRKAIKPDAFVAVNHYSHNGGSLLHHKLEEFFHGSKIAPGYDGMKIEI